ncbi:hypothetical protein QDR37_14400 [Amnibacterium sp. CER49]|uniref:hypothetical protein n=1 Tax=Amnibacterium sp. CER49 TaxID=3039161 RepID=UPI002448D875|nr:hypothetical protein [Amnibacterium sp. CER49]MDH2445141.1 hypothetical protein [Amnibacterium sp. CER49]
MTDDSRDAAQHGASHPDRRDGRVRPFRFQKVLNGIVRGLLVTPGICRLVGRGLVTLYVVGRRSGKQYTIPMAYVRHQNALLLGSGFAWGKNLRTGQPLELRYMGRRRTADVQVLTSETEVVAHYAVIARRNPGFAHINKIGFDTDGDPNADDLRAAWAAGARVFLLTLR